MRCKPLALFLIACTASACAWPGPQPAVRTAPNPAAPTVNQLVLSGNACGPAALLNAFRGGNDHWQKAAQVPGKTDRDQLSWIIRRHGLCKSAHFDDRIRWNPRRGINTADLTDMANAMAAPHVLPRLTTETMLLKPREEPRDLLRRTHARLESSLHKGIPPIASLRRYTHRHASATNALWLAVEGHFIVITSVPAKLERAADSFPFEYIDPWGGKRRTGKVVIPAARFAAAGVAHDDPAQRGRPPCLEAVCPDTRVGLAKVRPGEQTMVAFDAVIGRF